MIVGSGKFRYRVNADWAKLPAGWSFKEVGGVGVDGNDNVYVFNRGEHPMMVFDRAGHFLRSWGEGQYPRAHGVHMAPDDTMFLTDDGGHFVRKVTLDGKILLELGVPGKPAPFMSGEPFHRCTHTALSPRGEMDGCLFDLFELLQGAQVGWVWSPRVDLKPRRPGNL